MSKSSLKIENWHFWKFQDFHITMTAQYRHFFWNQKAKSTDIFFGSTSSVPLNIWENQTLKLKTQFFRIFWNSPKGHFLMEPRAEKFWKNFWKYFYRNWISESFFKVSGWLYNADNTKWAISAILVDIPDVMTSHFSVLFQRDAR